MSYIQNYIQHVEKTIVKEKNKLTVEIHGTLKGKREPRVVVDDLAMTSWAKTTGFNIAAVLKSGKFDNLLGENDSVWVFEIEAVKAPKKSKSARTKASKRKKRD